MRAGGQLVKLQMVEVLHLLVRNADRSRFIIGTPPVACLFPERVSAFAYSRLHFGPGLGQRKAGSGHLVHGGKIQDRPAFAARFFPVCGIITSGQQRMHAPAFMFPGHTLRGRVVHVVHFLLQIGEHDDTGGAGTSGKLLPRTGDPAFHFHHIQFTAVWSERTESDVARIGVQHTGQLGIINVKLHRSGLDAGLRKQLHLPDVHPAEVGQDRCAHHSHGGLPVGCHPVVRHIRTAQPERQRIVRRVHIDHHSDTSVAQKRPFVPLHGQLFPFHGLGSHIFFQTSCLLRAEISGRNKKCKQQ